MANGFDILDEAGQVASKAVEDHEIIDALFDQPIILSELSPAAMHLAMSFLLTEHPAGPLDVGWRALTDIVKFLCTYDDERVDNEYWLKVYAVLAAAEVQLVAIDVGHDRKDKGNERLA